MTTAIAPTPARVRRSVGETLRRKLTEEIAATDAGLAAARRLVAELENKERDLWDALGNAAQLP